MVKGTTAGWIATTLLLLSATAWAQPKLPACKPDPISGSTDVYVDARTGWLTGRTHFELHDSARIVVVNKNPFRYVYLTEVEETAVAEAGLEAFLRFPYLAGVLPPAPSAGGGAGPGVTARTSAADLAACKQSPFDPRDLEKEHAEILKRGTEISSRIRKTRDDASDLQESVDKRMTALRSDAAICEDLKPEAAGLWTDTASAAGIAADATAETKEAAAFRELAQGKAAEFRLLGERARVSGCTLHGFFGIGLAADLEKRDRDMGTLQPLAVAAQKVAEAALTARRGVETMRIESFYSTFQLDGPSRADSTTAKIKLQRRDITGDASAFATLKVADLSFGRGPRFVLGVGPVWSSHDTKTFGIVNGFIRKPDGSFAMDENGMRKSGKVIGVTEDSSERILPMVILHGRIKDQVFKQELYLSLGITAHTKDNTTSVELFPSLSVALAGRRLFLSVGGYWGRDVELDGDLYPGAPVPDSATTAPTRVARSWKLGLAISYAVPSK